MQYRYTLVAAALASVAAAQAELPECALPCFITAVGQTDCGLTDSYCTCSDPATSIISESVVPCLCESTCTAEDIEQVNAYTLETCTAAFEAEGETYEPSPPSDECPGAGGDDDDDADEATLIATTEVAVETSVADVTTAPVEVTDVLATSALVDDDAETTVISTATETDVVAVTSAVDDVAVPTESALEFDGAAAVPERAAGLGLVAGLAGLAFAL